MKKIIIAFVFLPIIFSSCDPPSLIKLGDSPCNVYGDSTIIDLNFGASVMPCDYTAKFEALVNDSRCPTDAVCAWVGMAQIGVRLNYAASSYSGLDTLSILGNGINTPKNISFNGILHRVRLLSLEPKPTISAPLQALNNYKAKISMVQL